MLGDDGARTRREWAEAELEWILDNRDDGGVE